MRKGIILYFLWQSGKTDIFNKQTNNQQYEENDKIRV